MALSKHNLEEIVFFFGIAFLANLTARATYEWLRSTGQLPWWAQK